MAYDKLLEFVNYGFEEQSAFNYSDYKDLAPLSENANFILESRYLMNRYDTNEGRIVKENSFYELCKRCSRLIASGETLYTNNVEIIKMIEHNIFMDMIERRFMFNSPALFNLGVDMTIDPDLSLLIYDKDDLTFEEYKKLFDSRSKSQMCFACFVIPVDDSLDGIYSSVKNAALVSMRGGGVGTNFGRTREKGADIRGGSGGKATGPLGWASQWERMAEVVVQGGRRRAALMGMLDINHPDIEEFIACKDKDGEFSYFNISVCITDEFMEAVLNDKPFILRSRVDSSKDIEVNARELWDKICEHAWKRGDPGIHFIDKSNQDSLLKLNKNWSIEATNPCGEMNLPFKVDNKHYNKFTTSNIGVTPKEYPIYESEFSEGGTSCNLGSINLIEFVKTNSDGTKYFDFASFNKQIHRSIYYLDLVIDVSEYPLKGIEVNTKAIRPVGLGIMGIHDVGLLLNLEFKTKDDDIFGTLCEDIAKHLGAESLVASVDIVNKLGKESFNQIECVKDLFVEYMDNDKDFTPMQLFTKLSADTDGIFIPRTVRNSLLAISEYNSDLFDYVVKSLKEGKLRNSRRISVAPTGCQVKDTFINTEDGLFKLNELGDIDSHRKWSTTIYKSRVVEQENIYTDITKFYINGYNNTKKITLSSGLELECTYNHMYRVLDEHNEYSWKSAESLKIGDRIVYKTGSYHKDFSDAFLDHIHFNYEDILDPDKKLPYDIDYDFMDGEGISPIENSFDNYVNNIIKEEKELPIKIRSKELGLILRFFNILFKDEGAFTTSNKTFAQEILTFLRFIGEDGFITEVTKDSTVKYRVARYGDNRRDNALSNSDKLYYDVVKSIENSTNYTYDIEVPENNTYIANSYISHNTISLICDASSGIEPNFTYEWDRRINTIGEDGTTIPVVKHYVHRFIDDDKLEELHNSGSISDPVWKTALEIDPMDHLGIVRIFAKYVDTSISKCVAKGTVIQTNKGDISIEDFSDNRIEDSFKDISNDNIYVKDMNGEWQKVLAHYCGGRKKTVKLVFENDFELECSENHKLLTDSGWKRAADLSKTDKVTKLLNVDYSIPVQEDGIYDEAIYLGIKDKSYSENDIFDIEVENTHSYLISGIVSHNTINLPNSATVDDIKNIYLNCYKMGIKGITIYRDGSRSYQPLTATNKKDDNKTTSENDKKESSCGGKCKHDLESTLKLATTEQLIDIFKKDVNLYNKFFSSFIESGRSAEIVSYEASEEEKNPNSGVGSFINVKSPYGTIYFSSKFDNRDKMREVFITLNKSGQELKAITEALSRLVSIILQESADYKVAYRRMCKTLKGIGSLYAFVYDGERTKKEYVVKSIPDLLSYVLPDLEYIYLLNKYGDPEVAVSAMKSYIPSEEMNMTDDDSEEDGSATEEDHNEEYIKKYNSNKGLVCPECGGSNFYMSDGCNICKSCGASKCGI